VILERCEYALGVLSTKTKQLTQELMEARAKRRESQLQSEQLQKEIKSLTHRLVETRSHATQTTEQLSVAQSRLEVLGELPVQEAQLQHKLALAELEQSQTHSEWQQIQAIITSHEQQMQERVGALRTADQRLKTWKIPLCAYKRKSLNVNSTSSRSQLSGVRSQKFCVS